MDLAVNTGEIKYMEIGRHRGMIANENIKIGSNSYEKMKTFKFIWNDASRIPLNGFTLPKLV